MTKLEAIRHVLESDLAPLERLVLVAILDHADEQGVAWPGYGRLSKWTGVHRRTVIRLVASLAAKGWLVVGSGSRAGSNRYHLKWWRSATSDTAPLVTQRHGGSGTAPPPVVAQRHPNRSLKRSRTDQRSTPRGWTRVPDDWAGPTPKHREMVAGSGVDVDGEAAKFRDHDFAKPKKDPNRTFSNWLRQAVEWERKAQERTARYGKPPGAAAHEQRQHEAEQERRRWRNHLIDKAKAGGFGPKARRLAERGDNLARLADRLEQLEEQRRGGPLAVVLARSGLASA